MHELELFHPEIALLIYGVGLIVGIVWIVFPFVVISRLGKIEAHLGAIRDQTAARPNKANKEDKTA
jgi:ABC-type spermidine/putrescine transport system permease subunit I